MSPATTKVQDLSRPSPTRGWATLFERDGFVVVPGLFSHQETADWKSLVLDTLTPTALGGVHVWAGHDLPAAFQRAMNDPALVDILREIVGPDLEFLSVKAVIKNAATRFPSPWHRDWPYWRGSEKISVWVALDHATPRNGCLRLIPGSHRQHFDDQLVDSDHGFAWRLDEAQLGDLPVVSVPLQRGGVLIFSDHCVHSSHANRAGEDRFALSFTYRNAAVKDGSTVWRQSQLLCGRSVNHPC